MKRSELEHIIRATGSILGEDTVIIVGSQAILASRPEEELPPAAMRSLEGDVLPLDDRDGVKADLIDGALGELSLSRINECFKDGDRWKREIDWSANQSA